MNFRLSYRHTGSTKAPARGRNFRYAAGQRKVNVLMRSRLMKSNSQRLHWCIPIDSSSIRPTDTATSVHESAGPPKRPTQQLAGGWRRSRLRSVVENEPTKRKTNAQGRSRLGKGETKRVIQESRSSTDSKNSAMCASRRRFLTHSGVFPH